LRLNPVDPPALAASNVSAMPSRSRRVIRILPVLHFCLILPSQRPPVAKTILSDARYAHDFDESGLDRYNISIFDISVRHLAMFDPDQNASTNDDGSEADRDLCLERGQRDPLCDATTNERRRTRNSLLGHSSGPARTDLLPTFCAWIGPKICRLGGRRWGRRSQRSPRRWARRYHHHFSPVPTRPLNEGFFRSKP